MTNTAGSGPAPLLYKFNFVQIVTFMCNHWMYYFDHLTKRAEAGNYFWLLGVCPVFTSWSGSWLLCLWGYLFA